MAPLLPGAGRDPRVQASARSRLLRAGRRSPPTRTCPSPEATPARVPSVPAASIRPCLSLPAQSSPPASAACPIPSQQTRPGALGPSLQGPHLPPRAASGQALSSTDPLPASAAAQALLPAPPAHGRAPPLPGIWRRRRRVRTRPEAREPLSTPGPAPRHRRHTHRYFRHAQARTFRLKSPRRPRFAGGVNRSFRKWSGAGFFPEWVGKKWRRRSVRSRRWHG